MTQRCALFDFDGTLFDSMYVWDDVGELFLRWQGKEPKPSMRENVSTMSLHQCACFFQKEYSLSMSPEAIMASFTEIVARRYAEEIQPKPGAVTLLEMLRQRGIGIGIVTASERSLVEAALQRCGMINLIDAIFTCSELGCGKDRPDIFRRAMEYFAADRSSTLVFEDALHALITAKADGFTVAAVFDRHELQQEALQSSSDFYLSDLSQFEVSHFFT
ncbi:MAG: HAD family phosphatase [Oscillospiraceae bacterium]|nr:HAD family phosphatase [Oscillospiraceae bacterium]